MKRRRANPTLVHHGQAAAARYHVTSLTGLPLADLYLTNPNDAKRIAQVFANRTGARVLVLDNQRQPGTLRQHPIVARASRRRSVAIANQKRARYRHRRVASRSGLDPRSLRTVRSGGARVIVGCPRGKYQPRKRRCRVGTRAAAVLSPKAKRNPIPAVEKARRIYRAFHGRAPAKIARVHLPGVPPAVVKLGPVVRIDYLAKKHSDRVTHRYFHHTRGPHPELYTGTDGSFHLLGGKMIVTDRGLEH